MEPLLFYYENDEEFRKSILCLPSNFSLETYTRLVYVWIAYCYIVYSKEKETVFCSFSGTAKGVGISPSSAKNHLLKLRTAKMIEPHPTENDLYCINPYLFTPNCITQTEKFLYRIAKTILPQAIEKAYNKERTLKNKQKEFMKKYENNEIIKQAKELGLLNETNF